MPDTPKKFILVGKPPTTTPSGKALPAAYPIHNAPRPLYGDITWQGEFVSGIFYAAFDPEHPDAEFYTRRNAELNAIELTWVSEDEVKAWAREWAKTEDLEEVIEGIIAHDFQNVVRSYRLQHEEEPQP